MLIFNFAFLIFEYDIVLIIFDTNCNMSFVLNYQIWTLDLSEIESNKYPC